VGDGNSKLDIVPRLISVPMCVYNGEAYLAEAIDSVLSQTYRPIELLLVDDGSTDRSGEIARSYGERLTYIHQAHAGIGVARNRGLSACRGEFIAVQDADDIWVPEKLAIQHRALMERPEAGLASGLVQNFLSPELDPADFENVTISDQPIRGHVLPAVLIRRSVFDQIGGLPMEDRAGQSFDWFMRYRDAGLALIDLPVLVSYRRIHKNNQISRKPQQDRLLWVKRGLDRRRQMAKAQGD
jgi:glycosyltransferase involved in cell wall biosynthesis